MHRVRYAGLSASRVAVPMLQAVAFAQRASLHSSVSLCRELTEGSSTKEAPKSGFQKLRHDMTNLFVGKKSEPQGDDKIDK